LYHPRVGLDAALSQLAALSQRCRLVEALDAWRKWPLGPTPYLKRRINALEAQTAGCAR
jgi:hypothetical protein